jgi:hypothetical protein
MKKEIFILLFLLSAKAFAEWRYYSEYDDVKHYYNNSKVKKNGPNVIVWTLTDFVKGGKNKNFPGASSVVTKDEINCMNETSNILAIITYSDHMQQGSILNALDIPPNYRPPKSIIPGSAEDLLLPWVCSK